MPARIERRVVLPAPLGPIRPTTSPRPTSKSTPRSAKRSPNCLVTPRAERGAAADPAAWSEEDIGGGRYRGPGMPVLADGKVRRVKLLFIGDVVGSPGRRGLAAALPSLRERFKPDLLVVNGENSAGGMGITEKTGDELFDLGAHVITLGNH